FAFISRGYELSNKASDGALLKSIGIFFGILLIINLLAKSLQLIPFFQKAIAVPCDMIVMRMIEVLNAIPGLLILIAFTALFSTQTIWPIIIIIGFLGWTGVARFFRAELLRVRKMEYIQAAKALGYSNWRTLFQHALPNAIGPVMIVLAFGVAGAILSEATLSFLGIGSYQEVTWGSLLSERGTEANWWMALFPGLAVFITILIFNLIGEGLKDAVDARNI
ncbi:MAG: ABC transporter permease, partial [Bacteroidota bacterium]